MRLKDEIKGYIASSGWTITQITEELNKRNGTNYTMQNLSSKIRKESLKYHEILEIADIKEYFPERYEIVWNRKTN